MKVNLELAGYKFKRIIDDDDDRRAFKRSYREEYNRSFRDDRADEFVRTRKESFRDDRRDKLALTRDFRDTRNDNLAVIRSSRGDRIENSAPYRSPRDDRIEKSAPYRSPRDDRDDNLALTGRGSRRRESVEEDENLRDQLVWKPGMNEDDWRLVRKDDANNGISRRRSFNDGTYNFVGFNDRSVPREDLRRSRRDLARIYGEREAYFGKQWSGGRAVDKDGQRIMSAMEDRDRYGYGVGARKSGRYHGAMPFGDDRQRRRRWSFDDKHDVPINYYGVDPQRWRHNPSSAAPGESWRYGFFNDHRFLAPWSNRRGDSQYMSGGGRRGGNYLEGGRYQSSGEAMGGGYRSETDDYYRRDRVASRAIESGERRGDNRVRSAENRAYDKGGNHVRSDYRAYDKGDHRVRSDYRGYDKGEQRGAGLRQEYDFRSDLGEGGRAFSGPGYGRFHGEQQSTWRFTDENGVTVLQPSYLGGYSTENTQSAMQYADVRENGVATGREQMLSSPGYEVITLPANYVTTERTEYVGARNDALPVNHVTTGRMGYAGAKNNAFSSTNHVTSKQTEYVGSGERRNGGRAMHLDAYNLMHPMQDDKEDYYTQRTGNNTANMY